MEKYKMFEPKMNFYYPGVVPVSPGVPAGEAVEPAETTPTTTATKKVEPRTRKEYYLAAIAGEDVTIPEPKTRQEYYLKEIAENGGGSGGYTIVEYVFYENANATFVNNEHQFPYDGMEFGSCFVSIDGTTTPVSVNFKSEKPVLCGSYQVRLTTDTNDDLETIISIEAAPIGENIPGLTTASVKLFNKSARVSDDFRLAVQACLAKGSADSLDTPELDTPELDTPEA